MSCKAMGHTSCWLRFSQVQLGSQTLDGKTAWLVNCDQEAVGFDE